MISFIFIIIIIIIIIIVVVIIIIMYVSFRSITMQNLEAVALKLAELWPFYNFSKIISDSEILDIHTYIHTDRVTYNIRWSRIKMRFLKKLPG